jgi:acyl-coenzyme A synthetase/AMP-(fatty) acid ligase
MPEVAEPATVAVPEVGPGGRDRALGVLQDGASVDLAAAVRHLTEAGFERQEAPEHLEVVGALARTASGDVHEEVLFRMLSGDLSRTARGRRREAYPPRDGGSALA